MGEPTTPHRTLAELERGLDHVRQAPRELGTVELVVARPAPGQRLVLTSATLDVADGLVGDDWAARGSRLTPDGTAHPDMQLNLVNTRVAHLVAGDEVDRRALFGDQLHLDLDLSEDNVPPGTRLLVGTATLEVTAQPHRGCVKFRDRFGRDALRLVNTELGMALHLRGVNARVVVGGVVLPGDEVHVVR
jgi:hypothetical protein